MLEVREIAESRMICWFLASITLDGILFSEMEKTRKGTVILKG